MRWRRRGNNRRPEWLVLASHLRFLKPVYVFCISVFLVALCPKDYRKKGLFSLLLMSCIRIPLPFLRGNANMCTCIYAILENCSLAIYLMNSLLSSANAPAFVVGKFRLSDSLPRKWDVRYNSNLMWWATPKMEIVHKHKFFGVVFPELLFFITSLCFTPTSYLCKAERTNIYFGQV